MDTIPHQNAPNSPPPFVFAPHQDQEDDSAFDFWGILNRRKWLVFLGVVTGMALGALYHAQCETVFKSQAAVKIEPKDPVYLDLGQRQFMGAEALDVGIRHDQFINRPNVVNECMNKNKLTNLRCFENLPEDKIVPEVIENLEVSQNIKEEILYELVFYSTRPDDSQTILNNLIATYEDQLEGQYKRDSEEVATLLKTVHEDFGGRYEQLTLEHRKLLNKKGGAVVTEKNGANIFEVQVREIGQLLEKAKSELANADAEKRRATIALNNGREAIHGHLFKLKQTGKIRDDGSRSPESEDSNIGLRISELNIQLRSLLTRLGEGHRDVLTLKETISEWESFRDSQDAGEVDGEVVEIRMEPEQVLQLYVQTLEEQIADIRRTIEINAPRYQSAFLEAQRIAAIELDIGAVEKQMDQTLQFVQIAKERLIEIDSSASANRQEGFNFVILQNATYGEPVWPILPVILLIGGLLGSLSGFGLGCLVELADKTFHNPDEIMKQLRTPLIGHIPVIGQSKRYLVENSLIEPIVCTYHRPKSQVSEAFRAVRTALYFNTQGKNHSVIQVTSPTPGDGKSTLASNLAVSIAQSGKRVLLVDADMRRPRQHSTFGISSKVGFATVLSGQSEWREVMFECEEIEGLTLMPCGAKPYNPAELSSSPQVKVLVEEMREEFDFVIIDTPPLLAVTDPCPIAARVDGVILCIRIKKNVRISAERATEMLANLGAKCLGLVVNGVGAQSGYGSQYTYGAYRAGYSYNGYGYGYGYGYGAGGKYYEEDKKGRQAQLGAPKNLEDRSPTAEPPVSSS